MSSKKGLSSKRTTLPRASDHTQAFTKDWTRLSHSGHFDLKRLKEAMLLLIANHGPLGPEYLDHSLTGDWADRRECRIGGDFLLVYKLVSRGSNEDVIFVRASAKGEGEKSREDRTASPSLATKWTSLDSCAQCIYTVYEP